MSYIKGETILPNDLIKEIQKYVQGKYIYIPVELEKRKKWGENSGNRAYIQNRNKSIYNKYVNGYKIKDLAEEFFLSVESIKKIVYGKNK
ncbi:MULTISPECIES: CD3324 family protein [Clostridium]|uniref:CD3324 family protein n=1 Tax=Clostridium TaxID=1485 RepID=UPI000825167D|nr:MULTISPECIES: CD3324 family protein [Clostridium]PJI08605.1 hypothetical protein CUB90_12365 [Clostridium sp. CT7]